MGMAVAANAKFRKVGNVSMAHLGLAVFAKFMIRLKFNYTPEVR